MLSNFLPAPIVGIIAAILYSLDTVFIPLTVLLFFLLGVVIPIPTWRKFCSRMVHEVVPNGWIFYGNKIVSLTTKTEWDVQGTGELKPEGWYLLISNHQSWLDVLVLERVFYRKVPMLKFFMKRELLWMLPVAGIACWAIGMPFMKRYSQEYLKKHPEKAGKDLEITKRACEKFKNQPITIINYIEGTRFTEKKHAKQQSPYKHLLKPKAGGFSFVIDAMGNHLDGIINTTIIYPDSRSFWQFMCGKTKKIIVRYEVLPLNKEMIGDYFNNAEFRSKFQQWTNQLWHEKDQLIDAILKKQMPLTNIHTEEKEESTIN